MKAIDKIKQFNPCESSVKWLGDKTIEQLVDECPRGDWMLRLAVVLKMDFKVLTLARARCAKTVLHLMKDERSIKAVEIAEQFGLGNATREELDVAAYAAYAAVRAAHAIARDCGPSAYAAGDAAYAAAHAAGRFERAAANAAAAYARTENLLETADICRAVFGPLMKELLNNL